MFESLTLRNFQCHTKLTINFDPRITVLTGSTDVGKSAVLRALRWVCQNEPTGTEFITHDKDFSKAVLKVDGHKITRKVGTSNEYKLDEKVFKAFGRDVPTTIAHLIKTTDDNFQAQLDAPFWFHLSPGQVSKELNRIINLGVIDETLSWLASETRRAKSVVEVTKERLQEAKQAKQQLAWVPHMLNRLSSLQALQKQALAKRATIALAADLVASSTKLAKSKGLALNAKLGGLKALQLGAKWEQARQQAEGLKALIIAIKTRRDQTCQLQAELNEAQQHLAKATLGQRCPICQRPLQS